ncbi:YqaJ viral recombinase family protein [Collinsella sp. AGMB00827]|uniref:YqaJ viral recombinase family protein n=1 Tax=Collinsella ureilytica TaxID=2869515 RepID=A0ABS7MM14_9ACTN|nr:YqaJ viral recombinase family protein [Collinsella urealyticum]MBY4798322.1 YqaJ viral recombinase family protein [Collinsella urealyticum]
MISGEGEYFDLIRFDGTEEEIHDSWLCLRRQGIGGSDVAAIMGLSPWSSPYRVWLDKTTGVSEDISGKSAVMWGNILEPVVGEHYKQNHPERTIRRVNAIARSIERPWAQASLDYEVKDPELGWGVLEIKTAGLRSADKWESGVPLFYQTQVAHYLSVTGRPFADVAVLIGGQDYREYRIMRDEEDIKAVNAAVDNFWNKAVKGGEEPDPAAVDNSYIINAHPRATEDFLELGQTPDVLAEYLAACDACKVADENKKRLSSELKLKMGDHRGIVSPAGKIAWIRTSSTRFDSKRFDADHPGLRAMYSTEYMRDGGLRFSPAKN